MLLLAALHRSEKRFPISYKSFTKKIVCEEPSENGWSSSFHGCKDGKMFQKNSLFPVRKLNLNLDLLPLRPVMMKVAKQTEGT